MKATLKVMCAEDAKPKHPIFRQCVQEEEVIQV